MKRALILVFVWILFAPRPAAGYSVLSHEAIIDAVWDSVIAPMIRARYHASAAQLTEARAYAYGGSVIQDIGYYPFSSRMFGDLTHYTRSGDFIRALINDATNADEYAFALGALSHYVADNLGHPLAVNRSVPLLFPKVGRKFGPDVTYEDNPAAHLRTEFAFDVAQVARRKYASQSYHDFIGFKISKPLLDRAVRDTYALSLDDIFTNFDLAVGTFRHAVSGTIPSMTKIAWATKQKEIERATPGVTREKFLYTLSRQNYEKEWGREYGRPNLFHRFAGVVLRIVPKMGPFRGLSFKTVTAETERLFLESYARTVERYRELLATVARAQGPLENRNFDTGKPVRAGDYRLADAVYASLLDKLAARQFEGVTPALRANVLAFYQAVSTDLRKPRDSRHRKLAQELQELRALSPTATRVRPREDGRSKSR